jgi:hypothetical protein
MYVQEPRLGLICYYILQLCCLSVFGDLECRPILHLDADDNRSWESVHYLKKDMDKVVFL